VKREDVKREDVKREDVKREDVKREDVKREDGEDAVESSHYVSRFTLYASDEESNIESTPHVSRFTLYASDEESNIESTPHVSRFTLHETPNTNAILQIAANGDLRKFLQQEFFTKWHLRWYRKRPVYWPLQSARRSYGFVLFHERVNRMTLYVLMRDYMDYFLNGVQQQIDDRDDRLAGLSGRDRKQVEREIAGLRQTLEEVQGFAKTMASLAREGYEPAPNWIDDGVILRLAPLWELIPLWKAEPRKHWERLARGDFDWSHIAMHYWQERVKAACKHNKSFAIAHGIYD